MVLHVLVAGDSRVRNLKELIEAELMRDRVGDTVEVEVVVTPGSGIRENTLRAMAAAGERQFDQIYLMAGVCDIMRRLGHGNLTPQFLDEEMLLLFMQEEYSRAQETLSRISSKPILCELVGLDIAKYNTNGQPHEWYQQLVNRAIPTINGYIRYLNKSLTHQATVGPSYGGYVHKMRTGKMYHRYSLVTTDGLHYRRDFQRRVARGIVKAIALNQ